MLLTLVFPVLSFNIFLKNYMNANKTFNFLSIVYYTQKQILNKK